MPIFKHEYPILEYDTEVEGYIKPNRKKLKQLPEKCLITFMGNVLEKYIEKWEAVQISTYVSEMREFPIYFTVYDQTPICLIQGAVGSAAIATMVDFLIGYGVKKVIACGSCGVLSDIPSGYVIIPESALRAEGASYHYLPPSRIIDINEEIVSNIKKTLENIKCPYILTRTWTTDAFYRETLDMIEYRKQEGCHVVEMECATMAAVAEFRNVKFGQILYSGDILNNMQFYDERDWITNIPAREKLFILSMEALKDL